MSLVKLLKVSEYNSSEIAFSRLTDALFNSLSARLATC